MNTKNYKNILSAHAFLAFFIIFIICRPLNSSAIMVGLSTEKLTKESGLIITGEVLHMESDWTDDKKAIYTSADILVHEIVKGKTPQKIITVRYEGGEIDGIGMTVSDAVNLEQGEPVLLFLALEKTKPVETFYKIVGNGQGKYSIDKKGIARKSGFAVAEGKDTIDNNMPLDLLINRIKKFAHE